MRHVCVAERVVLQLLDYSATLKGGCAVVRRLRCVLLLMGQLRTRHHAVVRWQSAQSPPDFIAFRLPACAQLVHTPLAQLLMQKQLMLLALIANVVRQIVLKLTR